MAYIVVRNNTSGYVSCVEKKRVKNPDGTSSVRDVGRVCGLGVMTHQEFLHYQKWAHSFKDQEMRRENILGSTHAVIARGKETPAKIKVVKDRKPKTATPKRTKAQQKVRQSYPVRSMQGYKGRDQAKTHTQIMRERKREQEMEKEMREQDKPKTEKWKPKPYFEPGMGKGK